MENWKKHKGTINGLHKFAHPFIIWDVAVFRMNQLFSLYSKTVVII